MHLSELSPRWIRPDFPIFKCPCCRDKWLTAKTHIMTREELWDILEEALGSDWNLVTIPPSLTSTWTITGNLLDITIHPSIDASASGHWHGWIKNGLVC